MVLDKFEGVLGGDLSDARRYADEHEILALLRPCGLELLVIEGNDAPGGADQRSRVYPGLEQMDGARNARGN